FQKQRIYNDGESPDGVVIESIDAGPTPQGPPHWSSRLGRQSWMRQIKAEQLFEPRRYWQAKPGEQIKVRRVLEEAIGLVVSLGWEKDWVSKPDNTIARAKFDGYR
ncbi:MAG TPA: hypothetical protein VMQ58_03160, partial [Candidatus Saccharimonadales bacterium]|nr:hypothetical protein [Candidatus Saccharimonadales bacterium]